MTEEEFKRKHTLFQKFLFAFRGMLISYKTEVSIRIQTVCALAGIGLGFYLQISRTDWLAIVFAIALVLITETMNTAVEKLVDLVSPGYNQLAGKVKDIAAGAVFMAAIISVIIALLVFVPYFPER